MLSVKEQGLLELKPESNRKYQCGHCENAGISRLRHAVAMEKIHQDAGDVRSLRTSDMSHYSMNIRPSKIN